MKIRIVTFNVENLFSRFNYSGFADSYSHRYLPPIVRLYSETGGEDLSRYEDFRSLLRAAKVSHEDDKRQLTALALAEANADIVCLQEVDNIQALRRFRDYYLNKVTSRRYPHVILHEGNDRRGIDVAAMASRGFPLLSRSHASMNVSDLGKKEVRDKLFERYPKIESPRGTIFRRDCLELELRVNGNTLSLFVCHFKSMSGGSATIGTRQLEALAVREIVERRFEDPATAHWVILGDLNDYQRYVHVSNNQEEAVKSPARQQSGLHPLLHDGFAINLMTKREPDDQWTHYYAAKRRKAQLDYILVSPAIGETFSGVPEVIRQGMPCRVPNSTNYDRYPRIGWDRPKASDHCPVVIELDFETLFPTSSAESAV